MQTRSIRFSLPAAILLCALPAPAPAANPGPYEVAVEVGVRARMRDGVALAADVYRPKAQGRFPVLLQRTPYDRRGARTDARLLSSHGYIVVIQDTRGRYESGGEWYPFLNETNDGYDTVEWAAGLAGADGKVGMFGGSYVGATQMLAAVGKPPHLEAVFPYVTASEYYDGWTYQSGVLMQWFVQSWTSGLARDTLNRKAESRPLDWAKGAPSDYPVLTAPQPFAPQLAPYYLHWLDHSTNDDYWKRWRISDHYPEMTVKALHAGGWHDIFLKGSIKNYEGLSGAAEDPEARAGQRLLVGPWAHAATSPEGKIGGVVFGQDAVLDMPQTILEWSDWALKGKKNDYAAKPPVKIFVMGENVWRYEKEFPLARQRLTRYYLHSTHGANGAGGDGLLSTSPPGEMRPDRFTYDPRNPVPTIGGRLCCANDVLPPGPFDQSPNAYRRDVLVYSTPPLERDVEVTGWIKLELFAASDARDPHFTATLVDAAPDGYARFLTDGIVRASLRDSLETPAAVPRDETTLRYEIDLWATSNLFRRGHRIQLYVSSSNFPRFSRMSGAPSEQTVYHDAQHPSALVLPVIPRN